MTACQSFHPCFHSNLTYADFLLLLRGRSLYPVGRQATHLCAAAACSFGKLMMTAGAVPHLKLMTTQGEGEEGPCPQPQALAVQLFFIQTFQSPHNDTRCSLQHSPRSPQPQLSGVHLLQFVLLCFICLTCIILPLGELHRDTGYLWYSPKGVEIQTRRWYSELAWVEPLYIYSTVARSQ